MHISISLSETNAFSFALLKDSIIVGCFGSLIIFIELFNLLLFLFSFFISFIPKIHKRKSKDFNFSFALPFFSKYKLYNIFALFKVTFYPDNKTVISKNR